MRKTLLFLALIPASLAAQDTVPQQRLSYEKDGLRKWQSLPFSGCAIVYHSWNREGKKDSIPTTLISYKDGRVEGPYKVFRKGVFLTCGIYRNQLKEGEWRSYDEWGRVSEIMPYVKGKMEGEFVRYQYSGDSANAPARLQNRVMYTGDTMSSALESYERDGSLYNRTWYSRHRKHGPEIYYYPSGKKRSEQNNNMGNAEGSAWEWYPGGALRNAGQYTAGKRSGSWYYYYPDGSLKKKEVYAAGELTRTIQHNNLVAERKDANTRVEFSGIRILFPGMEMNFIEEQQLSPDTFGLYLSVGSQLDPKKTWELRSNHWKRFGLSCRYERSLSFSAEGPHLDLVSWKHFYSKPIELKKSATNYSFPQESVQWEAEPYIDKEELKQVVRKEGAERWLKIVDEYKGEKLPWGESAVYITVRARKGFKKYKKVLKVAFPMGC